MSAELDAKSPSSAASAATRCYEPDYALLSSDIGRGNFSTISLGRRSKQTAASRQSPTSHPVAIKTCRRDNLDHFRVLQREWQTHTTLHSQATKAHPGTTHIIHAINFYENQDEAAIVMEYAPYSDLMHFVQLCHNHNSTPRFGAMGPLTEADHRTVIRTVCSALEALHAAGFAHRDVKPHNILVVGVNPLVVKLGDLGLAKRVGSSSLWMERNASGDLSIMCAEARQHARDGTPMRRKDYIKADVYAVGVTLFYLIEGALPTDVDVMVGTMPSAAAKRWPHVSPQCLDLLRLLLHPDPEVRPSPCEVMAHPWLAEDAATTMRLADPLGAAATPQSPISPSTPSRVYRSIGEAEFSRVAGLDPTPLPKTSQRGPLPPHLDSSNLDDTIAQR